MVSKQSNSEFHDLRQIQNSKSRNPQRMISNAQKQFATAPSDKKSTSHARRGRKWRATCRATAETTARGGLLPRTINNARAERAAGKRRRVNGKGWRGAGGRLIQLKRSCDTVCLMLATLFFWTLVRVLKIHCFKFLGGCGDENYSFYSTDCSIKIYS